MNSLFKSLLFTSLAFCALLVFSSDVAAQATELRRVEVKANRSKNIDLPAADLQALVADWEDGQKPLRIEYRYTKPNKQYTKWLNWDLSNEAAVSAGRLLTLSGATRRVEVRLTSDFPVVIRATSYVSTPKGKKDYVGLAKSACPCPAPAVLNRDNWCPEGNCEPQGTPTPLTPRHLVIHHSGTANTTTNYALVVKAIYDFHVNTNGWDDIGYNLVVAPDGSVYQGRGLARQGAHFCGTNAETLGICVLGNYEEESLSAATINTLTNLGAFLSCEFDINVEETRFHTSSGRMLQGLVGHRNGCATTCPGEELYTVLPTLRSAIDGRIAAGCSTLAAPQNLTAFHLNDGRIELQWDAYQGASRILIERSVSVPTSYEFLAEVDGDLTAYLDESAPAGANYYRIRALVDGALTPYSNEVLTQVSSSEAEPNAVKPRLVHNPVKGNIEVTGLKAPVDQAFISDAAGRTVYELNGSKPKWNISSSNLASGRYWLVMFSGYEWFTVPFEYRP